MPIDGLKESAILVDGPNNGAADVFEHRTCMIDGASVIDARKARAVPANGGTLTPVIETKDALR